MTLVYIILVGATNQAINADLIALKGWLEGNKLSLNVAKVWKSSISDAAARFGVMLVYQLWEILQKLQNRAAKLITNSPFDALPLPVIRAL